MKAWMASVALVGGLASGGAMAEPFGYAQGALSCGSYVTASDAARAGSPTDLWGYMAWASGYGTYASGQRGVAFFHGADTASVRLWLENYCKDNPLDLFGVAVIALMNEFSAKKTK